MADERLFSDGVKLAAASALSYVVAATYEGAYAKVYGIPFELVDIRLATVLGAFAAIASGWIYVSYVLNVFVGILSKGIKTFRARIIARALIPAVLIGAGLIGILGFSRWPVVLWLVVVFGLATTGVSYAIPLLYKEHATYRAKFEAYEADLQQAPGLAELVDRHLGGAALYYILVAFLSVMFALFAGTFNAIDREVFLRPVSDRPEVVLRIYGDKMVVAALDESGRKILPRYRIVGVADTGLVLRSQRLGKLTMARPARVWPRRSGR
jgi:hypothetical protein